MIDLSGVIPWHSCTDNTVTLCKAQCQALTESIDLNALQIQNRIGSASQNAQVYRATSAGTDIALKIILNSNHLTDAHIENELKIAEMLSDRVIAGISTRFPVVLKHGKVMAKLDLSGWFGSKIRIAQQRKQIVQQAELNPDMTYKDVMHLKKNTSRLDELIDTSSTPLTTFQVPVLVSELMYCDMNYLVTQDNSPLRQKEFYADIICQIIHGLIELFEADVLHDDLHFGNILLKRKQDQLFAVIHDFGTSHVGIDYRDYNDLQKLMANIKNTKDNFGIGEFQIEVKEVMSYQVSGFSDIEQNLNKALLVFETSASTSRS
jgi:hypothetical protein